MPRFLSILMIMILCNAGAAMAQADSGVQPADSLPVMDSNPPVPERQPGPPPPPPEPLRDSVSRRPRTDTGWDLRTLSSDNALLTAEIFRRHPWLGFSSSPELIRAELKRFRGKEVHFYVIVGLLLLFAILRNAFAKYFNDLFRVFFRTTLKQRQIREQLMQNPLPSLMLNGFFVLSGGLYLAFLLAHYGKNPVGNVWELALYCAAGLSIAYFVKFIGLKILGAIFGVQQAATSYIFVVFIINKMVGILLLPFLVLLAFAQEPLFSVSLYISYVVLAVLLLYRLVLTYAAVRNQVKLNLFHFLMYVAAFEVAPLILVYRGLLLYVPEMA